MIQADIRTHFKTLLGALLAAALISFGISSAFATDPYTILGVSTNASDQEIKIAHQRLYRKYHPDRNPEDPPAEESFKRVQAAWDVLRDPARRSRYDQGKLDLRREMKWPDEWLQEKPEKEAPVVDLATQKVLVAKTPKEFIDASFGYYRANWQGYRRGPSTSEFLDRFLAMNPSASEVTELKRLAANNGDEKTVSTLVYDRLGRAKSASQLLDALSLIGSPKHDEKIADLAEKNIDRFLKLNPTKTEKERFVELFGNSIRPRLEFMKSCLEHAKTSQEFLDALSLGRPLGPELRERIRFIARSYEERFLNLNPTQEQKIRFGLNRPEDQRSIARCMLDSIKASFKR